MICEDFPQVHIKSLGYIFGRKVDVFGQEIHILRTACNFGGSRAWFACPQCNMRCAVLYRIRSEVKCRKCAKLRYQSETLSPTDRRLQKARKIRERLGQKPVTLLSPFPEKPRHMRWATFNRLREECRYLEGLWISTITKFVERSKR